MKILLAVDGSTYGDRAVEEVGKRPWPKPSEIRVISAAEIPVMPGMEPWASSRDYFEPVEKSAKEAATMVVQKALDKLRAVGDTLTISSDVIPGSPAQVIVEEAERWGADLIVMGSRGLGAWSRLLLGSVSDSVVHHAKCSVEIVRRG